MGWIESYKSKGQKYYRYFMRAGEKPVHLGSAEAIVRKVREDLFAERTLVSLTPTEIYREPEPKTHGQDEVAVKGGVHE